MQSNKTENHVGKPYHLFDNIFSFPGKHRIPGPRISSHHLRYAEWFNDPDKAWVMIRRLIDIEENNPNAFEMIEKYIQRHHRGLAAMADGHWKGVN